MTHAKDKLIERLQAQRGAFEESNKKWDTVRTEWMKDLSDLFAKFDGWLQPLEAQGLIKVEKSSQTLREEDLDPYEAPVRKLIAPTGARVHIQPVARVVFGGKGRIDFLSGGRTIMLMKDDKRGWCFVGGSSVIRALEELTEDTFFQRITQLLS